MDDAGLGSRLDRARLGWWLFIAGLAAVAAYIAHSFLGLLAVGIFGYYATRPINRRLSTVIDSDDIAAWATILVVLLPFVFVLLYGGFQIYQEAQAILSGSGLPMEGLLDILPESQRETLESLFQNPQQLVSDPQQILETLGTVTSALFGTLMFIGLAVTLTYFLLANDQAITDGFHRLVGGEDTAAAAYASAVDSDLQSVFFGNFLFVVVMGVLAAFVYGLTNLFAPAGLSIPSIFILAFLTGVTSLIPIIVSKVIYLPVVGYLGLQALQGGGEHFLFVGIVFVVYFLVLDLLPQTFIQPYITGRKLDTVMMMFGYLLGPVLFGWYGLIVLPVIFLLILETLRIVLPELIHGETLRGTVDMGESVGATPGSDDSTTSGGESSTSGSDLTTSSNENTSEGA